MESRIHPTAIIYPNVTLGKNVTIEAYAVIGSPAEHRDYFFDTSGKVIIGDNCIIREYVTVNAGTHGPTVVGDNCTLLRGSHVGHDAILEDNVTLSCNAMIGGHARIMKYANIGLGATVKQRLVVGPGVMLGMNAAATMNLLPFVTYVGVPAKPLKQNNLVIERFSLDDFTVKKLGLDFYTWTRSQP
jgi:UDP-N-acetylglucosamine acyltransferase